jgi:hypothetical protein
MDFFKKLFGKDKSSSKEKPSIPMPIQNNSQIEPIVVQAVENLFPDVDTQKRAFKVILEIVKERQGVADPKTLLALLRYSNGNVENFRKAAWQSHPHFWMDEINPIFRTLKDAEEWVKSISKSQV